MVKADPSHDYYADLELPSTADTETIKKQFRLLAKQYHPDRNPGREIECIPKFQAIQAANEILSDPLQKKSYDRDRAKVNLPQPPLNRTSDSYTFKKPPKPPPAPSEFPPPPKRDPNLNRPFGTGRPRPQSASAEKFAQFTRAPPHQQWDRTKFEDAAKAETLRNLHTMRGQSQGPPPRVPPRAAPTAPKPAGTAPSPDIPHGPGPSPGFPGLSRTNSGRRAGFTPNAPSNDGPPAPTSAYAHVHRPDRPVPPPPTTSSYPYNQSFSKDGIATSPPMQRARPSMSPLRTSKSSGFEDVQRPGLQRSSSRYGPANTGERIDINGPGLARSASVRNSPTGQRWEESGPFGTRPRSQQQGSYQAPPPRHHSSSPRGRSANLNSGFSASESSSSEDEPPRPQNRPKATPRRPKTQSTSGHIPFSDDDPALTGQFPSSNYNTKPSAEHYQYPPPDQNGTPYQRNFMKASDPVDNITQGLNNAGIRHVHRDDVPLKNQSSQRTNGMSSEPQSAHANTNATFSAADWDGKFAEGDNVFRPMEPSRSRSPTKQPRPKLPNRNRPANRSQTDKDEDGSTNDEAGSGMPGVRHVSSVSEGPNKAAAFQSGKFSAEDWAERLRSQDKSATAKPPPSGRQTTPHSSSKQPGVHPEVEVEEHSSSPQQPHHPQGSSAMPDAMDVDENMPQTTPHASRATAGRSLSDTGTHRPSSSGVNLNDLKETAPFKPNAAGLGDLGDLGNNLPFQSRAAEELNLHQPPSSGSAARQLKLPTPPKPVPALDEQHLTQESWGKYAEKMTQYMDAWNIFNCKMIDHFRTRQEQISLAMYHNWVTAVGDGASADDFDGVDFVGSSTRPDHVDGEEEGRVKPKKAGYATYMQWLRQDQVCRTWWEVACEEHRKCMDDLGRARKLVKTIRAKEFGRSG